MQQGHLEWGGQEHSHPLGRGRVGAVCPEAGPQPQEESCPCTKRRGHRTVLGLATTMLGHSPLNGVRLRAVFRGNEVEDQTRAGTSGCSPVPSCKAPH